MQPEYIYKMQPTKLLYYWFLTESNTGLLCPLSSSLAVYNEPDLVRAI